MKKILQYGLLLAILVLAALFYFLNPAEHSLFPRCVFNSVTGLYCPGCGSQRAIHSLLHLDFAGVVGNNFLFLPAVLLLVYHYSRTTIAKITGRKMPNIFYYKYTPLIILIVIVLFWILRNLPWYPFTVLAPN